MVTDYYVEMGVGSNASPEEIRSAYRKQAMRWHPDKWRRVTPERAEEAKKKFQNIQEANSVLSDGRKRKLYNAGIYDPSEEVDEGFAILSKNCFLSWWKLERRGLMGWGSYKTCCRK